MIKDPNILLSIVNTKLRDFYPSLENLCAEEDYSEEEVNSLLNEIGYFYDSSLNQFRKK